MEDDAFASLHGNPRFIKLAGLLPAGVSSRDAGLQFDVDDLVEVKKGLRAYLFPCGD